MEKEEEDNMEEQLPVLSVSVPAPVPVLAPVPYIVPAPAPYTVPAPVPVEVQPEEPVPVSVCEPDQEEPAASRRSSRERGSPKRLMVTGNGKSYVDAVYHNLTRAEEAGWGKKDVSGRCGQGVHHLQHQANGPMCKPYLSRMVPNYTYNL